MATNSRITPSRTLIAAFGFFMLIATMLAPVVGCGSDDDETTASSQAGTTASHDLDRSQPGKVIASDPAGDASSDNAATTTIPAWLDIETASIAIEAEELTFEVVLAEAIPQQKPEEFIGIEWGYHIDTDADGEPDFGLYAAFPNESMTYGLFNHAIQERQAEAEFPGSFSAAGDTLTWTFPAEAIGSPAEFQWSVYTDAASSSAGPQPQLVKTGDKVPDNGWPGHGWFVFP